MNLEEEILHSYNNPINVLELYENIIDYNHKSKVQITNFYENTDGFIKSYLNQINEKFVCRYSDFKNINIEEKHKRFINDSFFKSLLRVICFEKNSSNSTNKRETFYNEKEYCLYFKGYRLNDDFINNLLPEKNFVSQNYYNDSTPKDNQSESIKFYLSLLESERFIELYNLEKHLDFLSNIKLKK